jgi:post-segregation antitoxin (ccd killing protein)
MPAKQPVSRPVESVDESRDLVRRSNYRRHTAEEIEKWRAENADAIASVNDWVEKHGLPLAKYRVW